jgi:hypothetical protein
MNKQMIRYHDVRSGSPTGRKASQIQTGAGGSGAVILDYEEKARATRSKMARFHTLRLARDAVLFRRFREVPKSAK